MGLAFLEPIDATCDTDGILKIDPVTKIVIELAPLPQVSTLVSYATGVGHGLRLKRNLTYKVNVVVA